ncbi:unnamed protein product [Symbiodinium necroappetens]|uniref:Uncharacterized protein n=1 Tax=Symbiodinium necroappetens TaxID=1628268 RepID=A0A812K2H6_9DINO|nr:unnamed protein product [Symbiodinium necroappetens]
MGKPSVSTYSSQVERFSYREPDEEDSRPDALEELIEQKIAEKDSLDRRGAPPQLHLVLAVARTGTASHMLYSKPILQLCADACLAYRDMRWAARIVCMELQFREMMDKDGSMNIQEVEEQGERWKEAHMLCTMAGVCLEFQQVEQAEHHARSAVRLANGLGDRAARSEALNVLASVFLVQPEQSEKAVMILQQEQAACIEERDELGEAMCMLSLANVYMELGRPKLVISAAEDARRIFKSSKDPCGHRAVDGK